MSIASEITRLQTAKANLKTSIEAKGVTVSSSATLDDYPDYVDAISGGGTSVPDWTQIGYTSCPQSTITGFNYAKDIATNWTNTANKSQAFYMNYEIMYFPKTVSTSAMTNTYEMFRDSSIETLEISIQAVTNMERFCYNANNLKSVVLKDVGNTVTYMGQAFQECRALQSFSVDTTNSTIGDITSLTNTHHMFCACYNLKSANITTSAANASITDSNNIFRQCWKMETATFTDQAKCYDFSGYELGKDTTNGCLCTFKAGSATSSGMKIEFQGSKIAAGSTIVFEKVKNEQYEAFKGATIDENADSVLSLSPISGNSLNCLSLFYGATWPNGCNHVAISGINNSCNLFRGTKFTGATKTIDLTNFTWSNCQNFQSMFDGSQVVTIIGSIDVSNATNMAWVFINCINLTAIPTFSGTTSSVTTFQGCFQDCDSITSAPSLDTSNATNFMDMFHGCNVLTTVPEYNAVKVTNFSNMFIDTFNLTTTSLDNILKMCIGATSYTGTKTLYQLGFRSDRYSLATFQALPSYSDFIAAGWVVYP